MYTRLKTQPYFLILHLHLLHFKRKFKKSLETSHHSIPNPSYFYIYMQNEFKNVITIQNPPRNQEKRAKKAKKTHSVNSNPENGLLSQYEKLEVFDLSSDFKPSSVLYWVPQTSQGQQFAKKLGGKAVLKLLEFRLPKRYVLYLSSLDQFELRNMFVDVN